MKKTVKYTSLLTLQILILGLIGIFGTFLSDYLISINWFGDYYEYYEYLEKNVLQYGARRHWYNWIVSIIFFIQVFRIIAWSVKFWEDELKIN